MDLQLVLGIITAGGTLAWLIIGLAIKDRLGELKVDVLKGQADLREDMTEKHAENKQAIAVHQAEDLQKFESISHTLNRVEYKIDKMNGK